MSAAIRISDELMSEARTVAAVENRSVPGQIEYWTKIGKCAEQNPDLPFALIRDILLGREQIKAGHYSEYKFGRP